MLRYADAEKLVVALLEAWLGNAAAIRKELTLSKPYGWVFFYQSRKWIETQRTRDAIIPCFPILVDRFQGDLRHITGAGTDLSQWLADYEKALHPTRLNATPEGPAP